METSPAISDISLPQRIWGSLVSPRVVFEYLKLRPRFLGVLIVLFLVNLAAGFLVRDVLLNVEMDKLADRGATEEVMAKQERVMRVGAPLGAGVGIVVSIFFSGAIFLFLSNVLLGGKINYRRALAAVGHAHVFTIPAVLVRVPLILVTQDQVQTSLAALLPGDTGFLFHFLNQLDIFSIWGLILGTIGLSVMAETPPRRAGVAIGAVWIILVVVLAGLGTALESLGGAGS